MTEITFSGNKLELLLDFQTKIDAQSNDEIAEKCFKFLARKFSRIKGVVYLKPTSKDTHLNFEGKHQVLKQHELYDYLLNLKSINSEKAEFYLESVFSESFDLRKHSVIPGEWNKRCLGFFIVQAASNAQTSTKDPVLQLLCNEFARTLSLNNASAEIVKDQQPHNQPLIRNAMQRGASFYETIIERANSAIVCLDENAKITFANPRAIQLFGFSAQELLGNHVFKTFVPHTDSKGNNMVELVEDIYSKPYDLKDNENENVTKDGKKLIVHWSNHPIIDDQGNLLEVISIGNDVTEFRKTQSEAHELSQVVNQMYDGVICVDLDGKITYCNGGAQALMKTKAKSCLGKSIFDCFKSYDSAYTFRESLHKRFGKKRNLSLNLQLSKNLSHPFFISCSVSKLVNEQQELYGYSLNIKDITSQKLAEQDLKQYKDRLETAVQKRTNELNMVITSLEESEAKYKGLVESTTMGVSIAKDQNNYYANPALLKMFGYENSQEEFFDKSILELCSENGRQVLEERYQKMQSAIPVPEVFTVELEKKNGTPFFCQVAVTDIIINREKYRQASFVDIDEQIRIKQKLVESEKLHRTVTETVWEIITILDANGKCSFVSKSLENILHYKVEDILQQNALVLTHEDDLAFVTETIEKAG